MEATTKLMLFGLIHKAIQERHEQLFAIGENIFFQLNKKNTKISKDEVIVVPN